MSAAAVLFVLPSGSPSGERILRWKDALAIDWGTILLFGGGIALGRAIFDTGLGAALGESWLRPLFGGHFSILLLSTIVAAVLMSEIASNTAAANVVIPLILSASGQDEAAALSLAFGATLGTSLGFMLPVSTPANAMIYGSRLIKLQDMIRAGAFIDLAGIPIVWLAARWLVPFVFN